MMLITKTFIIVTMADESNLSESESDYYLKKVHTLTKEDLNPITH